MNDFVRQDIHCECPDGQSKGGMIRFAIDILGASQKGDSKQLGVSQKGEVANSGLLRQPQLQIPGF
jgi:hypothetical protein